MCICARWVGWLPVCAGTRCAPRNGRESAPELLAATEGELEKIAAATHRAARPLRGKTRRAGKVLNRCHLAKHDRLIIPSDLASRRASLALHHHQVGQRICTSRLSNMLGTPKKSAAPWAADRSVPI
jgi:hypothetical protein